MKTTYRIYSADSRIKQSGSLFTAMFQGLIHSRYMAYRLFIKDIRAEYAKSAMGIMWDFLDPLILGLIFFFLMRQGGPINVGATDIPLSVFVIYGVLLYQTFIETILFTVTIITRSKGIIAHLNLPPEALILSCVYRMLFFSFFRIVIMLVFSLIILYSSHELASHSFSLIGFFKFLSLYPLILLPGLALGTLLAPLNAIYGDVHRAIRLIVVPLRYISPVMWPIPWEMLNTFNPIAVILTNLRLLATTNTMHNTTALLLIVVIFSGIFLIGWAVFHLSVPVIGNRA